MIEPEVASRWRSEAAFDRVAAVLIGAVAILAAVLAVAQSHAGLAGTEAQVGAARVEAAVSARISASSLASDAELRGRQDALALGLDGVSRQLQGTIAGDATAVAVGTARRAASDRLMAAIDATAATSGRDPLDAYAAGLIRSSTSQLELAVAEQNRLVDLAAVLGRDRAAWALLLTGWGVAGVAAVVAASALL